MPKLSEILAENPSLDPDLDDLDPGAVLTDGVYLFRVQYVDSDTTLYVQRTVHTDGIVARGLLAMGAQTFGVEMDD